MESFVKPRYEYKYRLGLAAYYRTVAAIKPYCRLDPYSYKSKTGRYLVRSLYFDCPDYSAYTEKMSGVYLRNKYRIRTYDEDDQRVQKVMVERKTRIGMLIYKATTPVSIVDYRRFMLEHHWGKISGEAVNDFNYDLHKYHLQPTTLVDYQREAYFDLAGDNVRFSFDHDVRYANSTDLFNPGSGFKNCLENAVIFEIKAKRNDIGWVSDLIQDLGLVSEPNSKYAKSFEQTAHNIWL